MARNWLNCSFSDLLGDRKSSFFWTWLEHIRTSDLVASLRARCRSDSYDAVRRGIIFLEYLAYCILYIPHIFMSATCYWGVPETSCRKREREKGRQGKREVCDTNGFNVYGGHKVCSAGCVSRMRRLYFSRHDRIVHLPLRSLYDRIFLTFCVCLTLSLKSFMYNVTQVFRLFVITLF